MQDTNLRRSRRQSRGFSAPVFGQPGGLSRLQVRHTVEVARHPWKVTPCSREPVHAARPPPHQSSSWRRPEGCGAGASRPARVVCALLHRHQTWRVLCVHQPPVSSLGCTFLHTRISDRTPSMQMGLPGTVESHASSSTPAMLRGHSKESDVIKITSTKAYLLRCRLPVLLVAPRPHRIIVRSPSQGTTRARHRE